MLAPSRIQTRRILTIAAVLLGIGRTVNAQEVGSAPTGWSLRLPSGAMIATGDQRNSVHDAALSALQISHPVLPGISVTGTFSWARSSDVAAAGTPKLDVFQSDLGLETCNHLWFSSAAVSFGTFAGAGAGVRSYNYRKLDVDATHNAAGYVSAGGELGIRRMAVRIEARDYMTGFKPLTGHGESVSRNDVVIMAAFRFNRRAGESR
jgi:hypothetical protein